MKTIEFKNLKTRNADGEVVTLRYNHESHRLVATMEHASECGRKSAKQLQQLMNICVEQAYDDAMEVVR